MKTSIPSATSLAIQLFDDPIDQGKFHSLEQHIHRLPVQAVGKAVDRVGTLIESGTRQGHRDTKFLSLQRDLLLAIQAVQDYAADVEHR